MPKQNSLGLPGIVSLSNRHACDFSAPTSGHTLSQTQSSAGENWTLENCAFPFYSTLTTAVRGDERGREY